MFIINVLFLILLLLLILLYYKNKTQFIYTEIFNFKEISNSYSSEIPKVIIQTYFDKSKIPNKVYENIKKFAPDYKHIIYDDEECILFLNKFQQKYISKEYTHFNLVDKFKSFNNGAHKADLFRYCYLYENGGIYLDIKSILIKPIKEIFINNNSLYTVIALNKNSIYQGIIAVFPKNKMIGKLINQAVCVKNILLTIDYHILTKFFYKCILENIQSDIKKLVPGNYLTFDGYNINLFGEENFSKTFCNNKLDRYFLCVFICDKDGNKIIRTRYSDFPW